MTSLKYHARVQFLVVYIREARPVDGWWLGRGIPGLMLRLSRSKAAMDVYDPKTIEERRVVARQCEDALRYGIRTYVDEMDDAVNEAYAAMPTRQLIGLDGRVACAGTTSSREAFCASNHSPRIERLDEPPQLLTEHS